MATNNQAQQSLLAEWKGIFETQVEKPLDNLGLYTDRIGVQNPGKAGPGAAKGI